ncbi:MAG: LiaI-LiaF-like domain-containing protein [Ignavibacteria bacterium]
MKPRYIFWGILFISFGLLILINNFTSIDLEWSAIWKLWPAVLILWGISLIVKDNLPKNILTGLTALVLALALFACIDSCFSFFGSHVWNHETFIELDDDDDINYKDFFEPFGENIKHAALNFNAGAGAFYIEDTTSGLISAVARSSGGNYSLARNDMDDKAEINFKMKKNHFRLVDGKVKNKVEIKLNSMPVWDLDFNFGAASVNFDLSGYKTENVKIDMGAASIKMRLGDKIENINVDVNGGASYIEISVPESSGCEVRTHSFLSSKNFDEFDKIQSGLYRTKNFGNSKNKIYLKLDTGISSIKIHRYLISEGGFEWE